MSNTPSAKRFVVRFVDGTQIGPLDKAAIRSLAKNGRLTPQDEISPEGASRWTRVERVPGLLDSKAVEQQDGIIPLAPSDPPRKASSKEQSQLADASDQPPERASGKGNELRQQILGLVLLVIVGFGAFAGYQNYSKRSKSSSFGLNGGSSSIAQVITVISDRDTAERAVPGITKGPPYDLWVDGVISWSDWNLTDGTLEATALWESGPGPRGFKLTLYRNGVRINDATGNTPDTVIRGQPFRVKFWLADLGRFDPSTDRIEIEITFRRNP